MNEILVQIDSGYFCAGIIFKNYIVIETAPIVKWSIGRSYFWMEKYYSECSPPQADGVFLKGWKFKEWK